jgi:pimeloyl-ACP methyl ester carboxylesterase
LVLSAGSYTYSGIHIAPQGKLVLHPGVDITLSSGAQVKLEGAFDAQGGYNIPIVLRGVGAKPFQVVTGPASVSWLSNLEFRFVDDVSLIKGRREVLDNLSVRTGPNGAKISIEPTEYSEEFHHVPTLHNIAVAYMGKAVRQTVLEVHSPTASAYYKNVQLHPSYYAGSTADYPLFRVIGDVSGQLTFDGSGIATCTKQDFSRNHTSTVYEVRGLACSDPLPDPVVFVPGYGGSVNLSLFQVASLDDTASDGWQFTPLLTDSYRMLVDQFSAAGVPVTVAYYDWRLPPHLAAERYLIPVLRQVSQNGRRKVNLIAHSYGGLVSRSYLQSDHYRGEVRQFSMLGTPNAGAPKAYPVWQAGEFPQDWAPALALVRWYQLQLRLPLITTLRQLFPSARVLQPTYPFLWHDDRLQQLYSDQNTELQQLNRPEQVSKLTSRGFTTTLYQGTGLDTTQQFDVVPANQLPLWPEGRVVATHTTQVGDGTVPGESSLLPGILTYSLRAEHNQLPGILANHLIRTLYPARVEASIAEPLRQPVVSLVAIDCPVRVEVRSESGVLVAQSGARSNSSDVQLIESKELHWVFIRGTVTDYRIQITAIADTPVRWWVDTGQSQETSMRSGQVLELPVKGAISPTSPPPIASATPSATNSPTALAVPTNSSLPPAPGKALSGESNTTPSPYRRDYRWLEFSVPRPRYRSLGAYFLGPPPRPVQIQLPGGRVDEVINTNHSPPIRSETNSWIYAQLALTLFLMSLFVGYRQVTYHTK